MTQKLKKRSENAIKKAIKKEIPSATKKVPEKVTQKWKISPRIIQNNKPQKMAQNSLRNGVKTKKPQQNNVQK